MTPAEIITTAGTVVGTIATQTASLVGALPFILLPMVFAFAGRIVGSAKGLLFYKKRGRR